jgi:hypothetical protein
MNGKELLDSKINVSFKYSKPRPEKTEERRPSLRGRGGRGGRGGFRGGFRGGRGGMPMRESRPVYVLARDDYPSDFAS